MLNFARIPLGASLRTNYRRREWSTGTLLASIGLACRRSSTVTLRCLGILPHGSNGALGFSPSAVRARAAPRSLWALKPWRTA